MMRQTFPRLMKRRTTILHPQERKSIVKNVINNMMLQTLSVHIVGIKTSIPPSKLLLVLWLGGTIIFGVIPDIAKDKGDDSSSVPDRAIVTEADTTAETTTTITTTEAETTITENTTTTIAATTTAETTITVTTTEPERKLLHFIVNTDSHCAHSDPYCSAAENIVPENYAEIDVYEDELSKYSGVYWACGKCSIRYRDILYPISDDE